MLFLFLGLLFVAGLGLIAEGGAALGSLWPLPFASKQFATYIVFIGTGGLFLLAALGGMVGALSGRNSWIMCGFGIMIVAQVGIVGAAVLGGTLLSPRRSESLIDRSCPESDLELHRL